MDKRECRIKYILDRCSPEPNTGCLLWTEKVTLDGYPIALLPFALTVFPIRVRRALWELTKGERLGRLELWQTCGVRSCLNLDHMETVDPEGREPGNKRLISNKIRRWQKEKKRKAARFEAWRRKNNGE